MLTYFDTCYLNCMQDTLSYLTTNNHNSGVVDMENWFNINKMLIKEYIPTMDLNKVWTKVPKTINNVTKNVAEYIDTKKVNQMLPNLSISLKRWIYHSTHLSLYNSNI